VLGADLFLENVFYQDDFPEFATYIPGNRLVEFPAFAFMVFR
jgi:hypothetical protein